MSTPSDHRTSGSGAGGGSGKAHGGGLRGWRDLWQVPVVLLAAGLLVAALVTWRSRTPGPDFDGLMASVDGLIEKQDYQPAIDILDRPGVATYLEKSASADQRVRFFLTRGDAVYLAQKAQGIDVAKFHGQVLDDYTRVRQQFERPLDAVRQARFADTLLSLGRVDEAIGEVRRIGDEAGAQRRELQRTIVERATVTRTIRVDGERVMGLLDSVRSDPGSTRAERIWAVARQSKIRLERARPVGDRGRNGEDQALADRAIRQLLMEIQMLDSPANPDAGPLFVILGDAYYELGYLKEAREQLSHAARVIPESDEWAGRANLLLGRLGLATARASEAGANVALDEARDRFAQVAARFPKSALELAANLGIGEAEAARGDFAASLAAFERVASAIHRPGMAGDVTVEDVKKSLMQWQEERQQRGDLDTALNYARLIEPLYPRGDMPADALAVMASTLRKIGERSLGQAKVLADGGLDFSSLTAGQMEEARASFANAAKFYRRHAKAVLVQNPDGWAESTWQAGDCFDRAGEPAEAIRDFKDFAETRRGDPRSLQAIFRMARASQSLGDHKSAAELFAALIDQSPTSAEAMNSYVPLAQSLLLASDDKEAGQAEARLLEVLGGGERFSPEAPQFRAALIELGRLYRRIGRYADAVERIEEAFSRFPELGDDVVLRFHLADAKRLSAGEISRQLGQAMAQDERRRLESLRLERLGGALEDYEKIRVALEAVDAKKMTDLQRTMLRNAVFYRGDCAFDLGEALAVSDAARSGESFEQAIRFYDAAAQRYAQSPSSLVAMVQIVNCYAALGKWREAQTAHQRARARLDELPGDIWNNPDVPMSRQHWERWLKTSVELESRLATVPPSP
ncbi:MAG: tetratricopeptide repeat protein [Phycisphaerales bacterium]|nr:tetratricopeptide repeat protein [Phycisphaerales bacterium]